MQFKVMIARFPYGNVEHPDVSDWVTSTAIKIKQDARVSDLIPWRINETPVTMARNKCLEVAKREGVDYVLMVDSDMSPDIPIPGAKPFWDEAFNFALGYRDPCIVASPYCGPPPYSNVYVFRWANWQNNNPQPDIRLEQYTREESAIRDGFEQVGALPTGLMLIDMRALNRTSPPYFYYEYKDSTQSEKASTEDVTFTRDLALAGVPIFVAWQSWSGHWKPMRVDKPMIMNVDQIREKFVEAVRRNHRSDERLVFVNEGRRRDRPHNFDGVLQHVKEAGYKGSPVDNGVMD